MMEVCSLEDEDYSQLFITQSSPKRNNDKVPKNCIIGEPMDFGSPCVSLLNPDQQPHYSDISDDDFDMIPCSQKKVDTSTNGPR